ncbi:SphA family protein [Pseudomonas akapageensis]|uniref:SphA family protein n=1 Tax=Pseudomonas akapageensis TaxID=2609961 RepID=UPI001FE47121|nr:transporter [Pseudomonas akapageensis]
MKSVTGTRQVDLNISTFVFVMLMQETVRADEVSLPPLALGNTSFEDGIAGPGILLEAPFEFFWSDNNKDSMGHSLPGEQRIRTETFLPHFAYISDFKLFGANYGVEILQPIVNVDLNIDNGPKGSRTMFGDTIISPMILQWAPVSLFGRPFWQRFNLSLIAPTGAYDPDKSINAGSNVWIVDPHYAFTYQATDKVEFSGRFQYAWSGKNHDPASFLNADSIQPGQAFHMNMSVSFAVTESIRVGVAGYALKQITDDKIDGVSQEDSREQVYGFGPGIMFKHAKTSILVNYYVESEAENRAEGDKLSIRIMTVF